MTVYVEKPTINLREELASLRNQGGYQEQQFWFDGLVTNGTFDADTNWTKGTGWTISGGAARYNNTAGYNSLSQNVGIVLGKSYQLVFDITVTSGSLADVRAGGGTAGFTIGSGYSSTQTVSINFTPTGTDGIIYFVAQSGAFVGSIDNISIFETDGTDVVHRMPKGWVPKDVFEDGLLQREGAANDYEVVYDGFDYFVKPAVAPSATTQTCVIGVKA